MKNTYRCMSIAMLSCTYAHTLSSKHCLCCMCMLRGRGAEQKRRGGKRENYGNTYDVRCKEMGEMDGGRECALENSK